MCVNREGGSVSQKGGGFDASRSRRLFCERAELEGDTQRELLNARYSERGAVLPQRAAGDLRVEPAIGKRGVGIKTHGVGGVEDLPGELQTQVLCDSPVLGEAGVDIKKAVATELVALARFARVRQTDR